ncbi:hypothetical protein, partial [Rhizobium sp. PDO1-076]|uniref:hypothetical protein n=1 Tax=Rhizobium sp. PDO1-076 TaxID=1125979 RepID=UPI001AEC6155
MAVENRAYVAPRWNYGEFRLCGRAVDFTGSGLMGGERGMCRQEPGGRLMRPVRGKDFGLILFDR